MASVRERVRSDGSITFQVLYRLDNRQTSETHPTRASALAMVALIDKVGLATALEIVSDRKTVKAAPTLAEWGEHYVETRTGVTSGTIHRYRRSLANDYTELIDLPLTMIGRDQVARWVNRLARDGAQAKTIANKHGLLFAIMRLAVIEEVITRNPCEGTRLPSTERREMVFLTPPEFDVLLEHVNPDARGLVTVLVGSGMRWGEATALKVGDWDHTNGRVTVARAWKYTGTSAREIGAPKTLRSRRTLAVGEQVADALNAAVADKRADEYIFTGPGGLPWRGHNFHEQVWQPAVAYANGTYPRDDGGNETYKGKARPDWRRPAETPLGKRPRIHDLRHTCASWLLARGVALAVIQLYLGHESITTTVDRYGHLEPAHMKAAAGAMTATMSNVTGLVTVEHISAA